MFRKSAIPRNLTFGIYTLSKEKKMINYKFISLALGLAAIPNTSIRTFIRTLMLLLLVSAFTGFSENSESNEIVSVPPEPVVLTNVTVIDGTGSDPISGATIVIENGKISSISTDDTPDIPGNANVMDLTGHYVIPGLIDGHVHLTDSEDVVVPKVTLADYFVQGITSVRDMAGNGTALSSLKSWASPIDKRAPQIYFSALVAGPNFLANDPRVLPAAGNSIAGQVSWMPMLDSKTDIPKLVSDAKEFGVTALKLYADIAPELVQVVTDEAHEQGLQVWSHTAVFSATPLDIVNAGVDAISHANMLMAAEYVTLPSYLNEDVFVGALVPAQPNSEAMRKFFGIMVNKNIVLDATLFLEHSSVNPVGPAFAQRAHELGVKVSVGTDGPFTVLDEIKALMQRAGFTANEAIVAATANNALVLGIEDTHGTITVGKVADLVVLSADPIANIDNLSGIVYVVKEGYLHSM